MTMRQALCKKARDKVGYVPRFLLRRMHKYQELDYQQIGESLELSVSAVKSLLFRAYERLRGELAHLSPNYKRLRA